MISASPVPSPVSLSVSTAAALTLSAMACPKSRSPDGSSRNFVQDCKNVTRKLSQPGMRSPNATRPADWRKFRRDAQPLRLDSREEVRPS